MNATDLKITTATICCPDCGAELTYTAETDAIECGGGGEGTCAVMTVALYDDGDDLTAQWEECCGDDPLDEAMIDRCRDAFVAFVHQLNGGMIA
jgi:hypothetical protein